MSLVQIYEMKSSTWFHRKSSRDTLLDNGDYLKKGGRIKIYSMICNAKRTFPNNPLKVGSHGCPFHHHIGSHFSLTKVVSQEHQEANGLHCCTYPNLLINSPCQTKPIGGDLLINNRNNNWVVLVVVVTGLMDSSVYRTVG